MPQAQNPRQRPHDPCEPKRRSPGPCSAPRPGRLGPSSACSACVRLTAGVGGPQAPAASPEGGREAAPREQTQQSRRWPGSGRVSATRVCPLDCHKTCSPSATRLRIRVSVSQRSTAIKSKLLYDFSLNPIIPEVYPKHRNESECVPPWPASVAATETVGDSMGKDG